MKPKARPPGLALMLGFFVLMLTFFTGCPQLNPYDDASLLHSRQMERNEVQVDGGLTDAQIDKRIDEAWDLADPCPMGVDPDNPTPEEAAAQADWLARKRELLPVFARIVRSWALTDLERDIRVKQIRAWIDYELSKRDPGDAGPSPELPSVPDSGGDGDAVPGETAPPDGEGG